LAFAAGGAPAADTTLDIAGMPIMSAARNATIINDFFIVCLRLFEFLSYIFLFLIVQKQKASIRTKKFCGGFNYYILDDFFSWLFAHLKDIL
jgi:hypothetical protein